MNRLLYYSMVLTAVMNGTTLCMNPEQKMEKKTIQYGDMRQVVIRDSSGLKINVHASLPAVQKTFNAPKNAELKRKTAFAQQLEQTIAGTPSAHDEPTSEESKKPAFKRVPSARTLTRAKGKTAAQQLGTNDQSIGEIRSVDQFPILQAYSDKVFKVKTFSQIAPSPTEQTKYAQSLLEAIKIKDTRREFVLQNLILNQPGIQATIDKRIAEIAEKNKAVGWWTYLRTLLGLKQNTPVEERTLEKSIAETLQSTRGKTGILLPKIDGKEVVPFNAKPIENYVIEKHIPIQQYVADRKKQKEEYPKIQRKRVFICCGAVLLGGAAIALKLLNAQKILS